MKRSLITLSVATATCATSVPAVAQPGLMPPSVPSARPLDAPAVPRAEPMPSTGEAGPKRPEVALALSVFGTVAPIGLSAIAASDESGALLAAGLIGSLVGPSFGHWYAGHYITPGLVLRGAGAPLLALGVVSLEGGCPDEGSCSGSGDVLFLLGAAAYLGGTIYDVATAGRAARDYNRAHSFAVSPAVISAGSSQVMGLGVSGSF